MSLASSKRNSSPDGRHPTWLDTIRNGRQHGFIWLDVTDIIGYIEGGNTTVSGIQRVVANLVRLRRLSAKTVIPIAPEYDNLRPLAIEPSTMQALIDALESGSATRAEIRKLLDRVYSCRLHFEPAAGDDIILAGAFWIFDNYDIFIRFRKNGVRVGLFVHDLIQIENPEYVATDATDRFKKSFADLLPFVDVWMANSRFVAGRVEHFAKTRFGLDISVTPVLLPTELPVVHNRPNFDAEMLSLLDNDYVLIVSTIEIRKNHILVLKIWSALIAEGIPVPKLVFVGKWGWHIDELKAYIDASGCLGKWLFVFNSVSDAVLAGLYDKCLFTIYPSFAEGFGLPIGESLAHGKPVVASSTTSMPEVGGDFARYIDPYDAEASLAVIRDILADRPGLTAWANRIRDSFEPRAWTAFCKEFYENVAKPDERERRPDSVGFLLPAGVFMNLGDEDFLDVFDAGGFLATPRMTRLEGWTPPAREGIWTTGETARLLLPTALKEGKDVELYLRIKGRTGAGRFSAFVRADSHETKLTGPGGEPRYIRAGGRVGPGGWITLDVVIKAPGGSKASGKTAGLREVPDSAICLSSVAICEAGSKAHRLDVIEQMAMQARPEREERKSAPANALSGRDFETDFCLGILSGASRVPGFFRKLSVLVHRELARYHARRRSWPAAQRYYAHVLLQVPDSAADWKQFGHMVKEQERYRDALIAYSIAARLDGSNPDTLKHLEFVRGRI